MRFIANDQVPTTIGNRKLGLYVFIARELVQARDYQVALKEPVSGAGGFKLVVGQDLEGELEAPVELILPLLSKAAWADHEAATQVARPDLCGSELRTYEVGSQPGLPPPGVVERRVLLSLPPALSVPVGFAMSYEYEPCQCRFLLQPRPVMSPFAGTEGDDKACCQHRSDRRRASE